MRIESVTAHAFGPFEKQTLKLAPGMTVVHGPQEAGKSTWHAALYLGLCGMRRGRGRPTREDQDLINRHAPWDGDLWEVSETVRLEDGRVVELHHDLAGGIDCTAKDTNQGRDYTSEIINEGRPDGSKWLGLDRRSFLSTACVRQVEIQAVRNEASALQEHLQRAASTAGTDATAAAALASLANFHRDHVGLDRANSTKPLRAAIDRHRAAERGLTGARDAHGEYLRSRTGLEALEQLLEKAETDRRLVEAAGAVRASGEVEKGFSRAEELSKKYPEPPQGPAASAESAEQVASVVRAWETRPPVPELSGKSAEELQAELDSLPPTPDGDTEPSEEVRNARDDHLAAQRGLERHRVQKPSFPSGDDGGGLSASEIDGLAQVLELEAPEIDPELSKRVNRAKDRYGRLGGSLEAEARPSGTQPRGWLPQLTALFGRWFRAIGRVVFGWMRRRDGQALREAFEDLRAAEHALGAILYETERLGRAKSEAVAKAAAHGLASDAAQLRATTESVRLVEQARQELGRWEREDEDLQFALDTAEDEVRRALADRGEPSDGPVHVALERYTAECRTRTDAAANAARRPSFEEALAARQRADQTVQDARLRRGQTADALGKTAERLGIGGTTEDERATSLKEWLDRHHESMAAWEVTTREWQELQDLLDDRTLGELESQVTQRRQRAKELAGGLQSTQLDGVRLEDDADGQLDQLRQTEGSAREALNHERGRVEELEVRLASVAEAEEELAHAQVELAKVRSLGRVIQTTIEYLRQAQDRVHRDLAPVLRAAVRSSLPAITAGRYTDVRVDAATLDVQVLGPDGRWRDAAYLSHGTGEQIYLLLRVALARHLTKPGEICPLILDDVTVQCDHDRKIAVLHLLHEISTERQVILFSQENEVAAWARANLVGPVDQLVELKGVAGGL